MKHYVLRFQVGLAILLLTILLFPSPPVQAKGSSLPRLCEKTAKGVVGVVSTSMPPETLWQPFPPTGMGSGFVLDDQGHIVTVTEVISDPHNVEVILYNGHRWPTKLLGKDLETGLAVLEVRAPKGELKKMRRLPMGTADSLRPGQQVIALANPFGTGFTVAKGVVSTVRPTVLTPGGHTVDQVIQTDIPVPRAWCGGPLVDMSGRVIGVNTRIFSPGKTIPGVGFALSTDTISWVASQIISNGRVERPWMGATLQTVTPTLARLLGLPVEHGAMVTALARRGPGATAGLQAARRKVCIGNQICPVGGDIIVAVDGKTVKTDADVLALLRAKAPGDTVMLTVYREERQRRISVTLAERPSKR